MVKKKSIWDFIVLLFMKTTNRITCTYRQQTHSTQLVQSNCLIGHNKQQQFNKQSKICVERTLTHTELFPIQPFCSTKSRFQAYQPTPIFPWVYKQAQFCGSSMLELILCDLVSGRINRKTKWVFLTVGVNQGKIRVAKPPRNGYVVP